MFYISVRQQVEIRIWELTLFYVEIIFSNTVWAK
jgi:hypothetical protein